MPKGEHLTLEHQRKAGAARWKGTTLEQRQAATKNARLSLAIKEIRQQIAASRRAQGLPEHVDAERFLDELAKEIIPGGGPLNDERRPTIQARRRSSPRNDQVPCC